MANEKTQLEKFLENEKLTENEVITLIKSAKKEQVPSQEIQVSGKSFKYISYADPHMGHMEFKEPLWDLLVKMGKKERPDFYLSSGDNLEGMSGRPGHIYELSHVGFQQQIEYATGLLSQLNAPIYSIDGNHDGWYAEKNSAGVIVGRELETRVKGFHHLGQMEGDLIVNGVDIKLFHGNDGTAYADSYKLQKLIESLEGGKKPHIIHSGHYHKELYMFKRNVHGFECGTLMGQSKFMRGKKIAAAMGFNIITVYYDTIGVNRLIHQFVPFYGDESLSYKINIPVKKNGN